MPSRKRAFKSPSEEYNRILDVVTKYAIHNPHVAWVCKKVSGEGAASSRQATDLVLSPAGWYRAAGHLYISKYGKGQYWLAVQSGTGE